MAWLAAFALNIGGASNAGEVKLSSGSIDTASALPATAASLQAAAGPKGEALALLQFSGPIQPDQLEAVKQAGAVVHHYIPDYAYLVSLNPNRLASVQALAGVQWVGDLKPARKIHPKVAKLATQAAATLKITVLSVDELPTTTLANKKFTLQQKHKTQMGWHDTRLTIPAAELPNIAGIWSVFHIESQPNIQLFDERSAQTEAGNYAPLATAPSGPGYAAWLASKGLTGGAGITVHIQDDGFEQGDASNLPGTAHADFLGRIVGVFNATSDPLGDCGGGHGSLNAGVIMGNASVGTTDAAGYLLGMGLAPQGSVYATKIFTNAGPFDIGLLTFTDLSIDGQNAGAIISSNSWGSPTGGDYDALAAEFDALARDADPNEPGNQPMIYFFSAGNSGPFGGTVGSPGTSKNVITVGASENSDQDGTDGCLMPESSADSIRDLGDFSSRGPNLDGRFGVTLVAVGTHVQGPASTSINYAGTTVCDPFWPDTQFDYARSTGTSHACPAAAGSGMVVYEFFNTQLAPLGHTATPSPAMMMAAMTNTATSLVGGDDGAGGIQTHIPNAMQGWGLINLKTLVDMKSALYSYDQATRFTASGQVWEKDVIVVDPAKPIKVTLAWSDAPGVPGSPVILVNDLDLKVIKGATTYQGNVFSNGLSQTGGAPDRRNNLEACFIPSPTGTYKIRVEAFNIAGDGVPNTGGPLDQDFAVFVWNGTDQTSAGTINLDQSAVQCGDLMQVTVSDADLKGSGTVNVSVAATSGDVVPMTLTETAPISGIFTDSLTVVVGAPNPDAILQVVNGDTITATYNDADSGAGSPAVATDTAVVDCTPPVIFNVNIINIGPDRFTVTFQTNEPADGVAVNALTCGGVGTTRTTTLGTFHSINFTGLTNCTKYAVRLEASDAAGNTTTDNNGGACYIATTLDLPPLLFFDDFEPSPLVGWTHSATLGVDNWAVRAYAQAKSPTQVYSYQPGTVNAADASLVTPSFQGGGEFIFWHTFAFETFFDGGVIEISTNGGGSWVDLGPKITLGDYDGTVTGFTGNPLGDREAWTGGGLGLMTQVRVNLDSYPGTVKIRFRFGSDVATASGGWLIDDIEVREPAANSEPCVMDSGIVRMDRDQYGCGQSVALEVRDLNAPAAPLNVVVTTTAGDTETVTLLDPELDKIFNGSLLIGALAEPVVAEDARLQGFANDSILARYTDADDGTGSPTLATDIALLDCVVPIISNVAVASVGPENYTVTFDTNEPTTSRVVSTIACSSINQTGSGGMAVAHSVLVIPVAGCSTHHFRVHVMDPAGNSAMDDNGGVCYPVTLSTSITRYLQDDFEPTANAGVWSHSGAPGPDNWAVRISPYAHSASNVYSSTPGSDFVTDVRLVTQSVQGGGELSFWHTYDFQTGFDGGVIEISTNNGASWFDLGPYITQGGYTGTISTCCTSPIGGRQAWTGGFIGAMTQVKASLALFPGMVRIRFRIVHDDFVPSTGWQIDDVEIYKVISPCPQNDTRDWSLFE